MGRGLRKQFDYANAIGARQVVIVGDKDLALKKVTLRDMATGKERKVKLSSL